MSEAIDFNEVNDAKSSDAVKHADTLRLQRVIALVVTGIILYVPANIYPVMTLTITGDVQPLTIIGGVQELYDTGLAPIAAIVFLASIVVPFFKLASLSWLLLMHGNTRWQRNRTVLLRFLRLIGSWSMVDLFLLSILVAVGQLGLLASVRTGIGALFFAAVLVASILAADIYEARMIWLPQKKPSA